jgi:RNA recognition motif-containing protein
MKIFVGNLSTRTVEQDLLERFKSFGEVAKVNIARTSKDRKPRGFGYVDMKSDEEGQLAIDALHGLELHGEVLVINEAHRRL